MIRENDRNTNRTRAISTPRRGGLLLIAGLALAIAACTTGSETSTEATTTDASELDSAGAEQATEEDAGEGTAAGPTAEPTPTPTSTPTPEPTPDRGRPVTERWRYDGLIRSEAKVIDDHDLVVFIADIDGQRYDVAVDIESGDEVWRYPSTRGVVYSGYGPIEPPVIDDIYITLVPDSTLVNQVRIQALDVGTGAELWASDTLFLTEYPALCKDKKTICVTDRSDTYHDELLRFDPATGNPVEAPPRDPESDDTVAIDQYPTPRWVRFRPDGTEVWSARVIDVHGIHASSAFGFGARRDEDAGVVLVGVGTSSTSLEEQVLAALDYDTGELLWRSEGRSLWGRATSVLPDGSPNIRVKSSGTRTYTLQPGGGVLFDEFIDIRETVELFDVETGETQLDLDVAPYADWERVSETLPDSDRSALIGEDLVVLSTEGPMRVSPKAVEIEPIDPNSLGWCEPSLEYEMYEDFEVINDGYLPCTVGDLKIVENPSRLPQTMEQPIGEVVGDTALLVAEGTLRAYHIDETEPGD